jgi:NAD(P)H dehydrogenase (quinone)
MIMKVLIICGHPSKDSLSNVFSDCYEEELRQKGHLVKRINLFEISFDPILWEGYKKNQLLEDSIKYAQESIKWAEHLVFFYPIWWFSMPSLLKGFIDRTFLPGFAFKYTGKNKWKMFLRRKTAHLIVTSGGSSLIYRIFGIEGLKELKRTLQFCGIFRIKKTIIGNASSMDKESFQKNVAKIRKIAKNL